MKTSLRKLFFGFSLVEILVALIAVSCISAALAPVITKKLKSNAITVGSMGGKMEFVVDCSAWGDDCVFCTEDKCSLCAKDCNDNEFVFTQDCICKNCSEVDANCIQCTAKKCKKCRTGYGLVNYRCEQCSAGTYSDGTTECLKAPIGYYVASAGQGSATPCGVGTYQNEEGKTSCKTCSAGTYQDETGKSSCKTCEIDYMCTGGNNRTQCAANYGANAGSSSCSPCPSYCADCQVPNTCLKCNGGFYLSNNTCYPCTAGYSCNGTTTQTACPAGYYSGAGKSSCSACGAGSYSSGGTSSCSSCSAGSYSGAGAGSCTSCSAGYYAPAGASSCTQCSAGTYAPAGASSCSACSSGYYSSAGASSCTACSTTWANCTTCAASGCTACASGYELNGSGGCKEGAGPPRNQADCDPYNALYHNGLCITKFNAGDAGGPPLSSATVVQARQSCNNGVCCWQGNTAASGWCDSGNGPYGGCNRTVCQYQAAINSCDAWAPSAKATEWRLPTYAEVSQWSTSLTYYQGANGLQGCTHSDRYNTPGYTRCSPAWDVCNGIPRSAGGNGVCNPQMIWTSDYYYGAYYCGLYNNNTEGICYAAAVVEGTWQPLSVRCVTSYIIY